MKKILFLMTLLVMGVSFAFAQTNADIKFCLLYTSDAADE